MTVSPGDNEASEATKQDERAAAQKLFSSIAFGPSGRFAAEFEPRMAHWRDRDGNTPLIMAACYGNREAVETLLSHSDANAQNSIGATALMGALGSHCFAVAARLAPISDLSIKNNRGGGPLNVLFRSMGASAVEAEMVAPLLPGTDPAGVENGAEPWTAPFAIAGGACNWSVVDAFLPHVPRGVAQRAIEEWGESHFPLFRASQEAKALREAIAKSAPESPEKKASHAKIGAQSAGGEEFSPGAPARRL